MDKLMRLTLSLGLFILLAIAYSLLFKNIPINSDSANYFLQAEDILNGNIFLKHWILTIDTYYTIDTFLLSVGMLIIGPSLTLFYIVPAIVFALIVLMTLELSQQKSLPFIIFCFVFIMLGLPSIETASLGFGLIAYHSASLMYCLLILLCLIKLKKPRLKLILCFVLTYLLCIGDPWLDFVLVLPLFLLWLFEKKSKAPAYLPYSPFIFLSAALLAHLTVIVFSHSYPLLLGPTDHDLSSPKESLLALIFLALNFINLANIHFNIPHYLNFIHELGLMIILFGLIKAIKDWKEQDWLNKFFVISILTMVFAFVFSETSLGSYLAQAPVDIFSARYLISSYVFAIILAVRVFRPDEIFPKKRIKDAKALMAIFLLLNLYYFIPLLFLPKTEPPIIPAVNWLESHGYSYGYANYWQASSVTVMTSGKLTVRALINPPESGPEIVPQGWLSKTDWYDKKTDKQGSFFILDSRYSNPNYLNKLILNFGEPEQIIHINGYIIVIWKENIANKWRPMFVG